MAGSETKRLCRETTILLSLVAVVCPLLYRYADLPATAYAHNAIPRAVVAAANATSNFDDYINAACVMIGLYALVRQKNRVRFWTFVFPPLASLFAGLLTHLLKWPIGRWRPKAWFEHGMFGFEPFGGIKCVLAKHSSIHSDFCATHPFARSGLLISFPSGHSSSIMAIMAAIAILRPRFRYPCCAIAIALGSTRIVVGAHYPSDVVAGLVLGYLAARWLHFMLVRGGRLPEGELFKAV